MAYRVIRDGVSQREGDGFVDRKVGDTIELSPAAAEHFLAEGYAEEIVNGTKPVGAFLSSLRPKKDEATE